MRYQTGTFQGISREVPKGGELKQLKGKVNISILNKIECQLLQLNQNILKMLHQI